MKIIFNYFEAPYPEPEEVADEVERVGGMLREGYTSGELVGTEESGRGWWSVEEDDDA